MITESTPAVTASELLHGVHRATYPAVRGHRASWLEAVLDRVPGLAVEDWAG